MSKESSKPSTSLGALWLGSTAGAALAYFPLGPQTLAWVLLGMIGLTALLGSFQQLKRGRALWVNVAMGALGGGSMLLANFGLGQYMPIGRVLAFLLFAFVGLSALGALLKIIFGLGGMALMVFIAISVFEQSQDNQLQGGRGEEQVKEEPVFEEDGSEEEALNSENAEDVLVSHIRSWKDYEKREYKGELEIWKSKIRASERNKEQMRVRANEARAYWKQVYASFVQHDTDFMERVLALFLRISEEQGLDKGELAKTVVACVQSIPYSLIYRGNCDKIAEEQPSLAGLASQVPCKSNVEYGLQTPASFLDDLQGDCDTRTVFLFTIMDKLGYKVAILNSDVHGHSMLGVSLSAIGKYKEHRGRKYYFWETTAKGWKLGVLPPDMGQPKDWYVVLDSER